MDYLELIQLNCPLFAGISREERTSLLSCLSPRPVRCRRGQLLWQEGDRIGSVGIVEQGAIRILRDDFWGNRAILSQAEPGDLFGEAYAWGGEPLGVSVEAAEDSRVWLLDVARILTPCTSACSFHTKLVGNLVAVLAGKNRLLSRKIDHLSQRSTRAKVLSYLSFEAARQGSASFSIPFDRQGMADYLAVDRSALSQELSKMRRDGLLDFHKNQFRLLEQ